MSDHNNSQYTWCNDSIKNNLLCTSSMKAQQEFDKNIRTRVSEKYWCKKIDDTCAKFAIRLPIYIIPWAISCQFVRTLPGRLCAANLCRQSHGQGRATKSFEYGCTATKIATTHIRCCRKDGWRWTILFMNPTVKDDVLVSRAYSCHWTTQWFWQASCSTTNEWKEEEITWRNDSNVMEVWWQWWGMPRATIAWYTKSGTKKIFIAKHEKICIFVFPLIIEPKQMTER